MSRKMLSQRAPARASRTCSLTCSAPPNSISAARRASSGVMPDRIFDSASCSTNARSSSLSSSSLAPPSTIRRSMAQQARPHASHAELPTLVAAPHSGPAGRPAGPAGCWRGAWPLQATPPNRPASRIDPGDTEDLRLNDDPATIATRPPRAEPIVATARACRRTIATTRSARAPSAIRTAISRARIATL